MAFGKFGTYKKVEILIDAVELIRKSSDEAIEIVIAGTDSPIFLDIYNRLKKICTFLELYSPVTLRKIKSQLFLTKAMVVFPYFYDRKLWSFASGWKLRQSSSNARFRDLILVKEEGYKGIFNPKVQSLWQSY
jgi:hypothetical protein